MTDTDQLLGRRVTVQANGFVDMRLHAWIKLIEPVSNSMLLEFDAPVEAAGVRYRRAVASSRLQRDNLDSLVESGVLGAAITWIPDDQYKPGSPFDLSWWRGGAAAIADIVL